MIIPAYPEENFPIDPLFEDYILAKLLFKEMAKALGYSMLGLLEIPQIQSYLQNKLRLSPIHGKVRSCQLSIYDWKSLLLYCLKFFLKIAYSGAELEEKSNQLWIDIDGLNYVVLQSLFFKVLQLLKWKFLLFLICLKSQEDDIQSRIHQFWQSIESVKGEALEPIFNKIFSQDFKDFS